MQHHILEDSNLDIHLFESLYPHYTVISRVVDWLWVSEKALWSMGLFNFNFFEN